MRNITFAIVFIVFFLIQLVIKHLPLNFVRVDLIFLGVIYLGFYGHLFPHGFFVLILGLVSESLGSSFHGLIVFPYMLIFLFLRGVHQHLFFQGGGSQVLWVLVLSLVCKGIQCGLLVFQDFPAPYSSIWDFLALGMTAFFQGAITVILFPFLERLGGVRESYGA